MKMKPLAAFMCALSLTALASSNAMAGSKKLSTIAAAKVVAERAVIESVIGLKVRARERVEEMVAKSVVIDAKTQAAIKGVRYEDIVYDKQKDIAKVVAYIRVGQVENIIGRRIDYGTQVIKRVGFATSTPANAGPLKALRAAELDAYKELAKQIVGFKLKSRTSVEDFILKSDKIQTKLMAAIYGAELGNYSWDEDGDATVTLRLKVSQVEDVLKQRLDYQGQYIEVQGSGAQIDDFSEAQSASENYNGSSSQVKYGSLGIPIANPSRRSLEGQGTQEAPRYDSGGAYNLQ